jgi:hypothetical protein
VPRAKKNRPPRPPRVCVFCADQFVPNSGAQKYCDLHKNQHTKSVIDRRALGIEPNRKVYPPKDCAECGFSFLPSTGSAKYCSEHRRGNWERNNPDKARETGRRNARRWRHKRDYGDPDIYDRLVEQFGEKCAICRRTPAESGNRLFHLAIDHDHESGEIRGLLCQRCNTGLGYFEDDAKRLRSAANYVTRQN